MEMSKCRDERMIPGRKSTYGLGGVHTHRYLREGEELTKWFWQVGSYDWSAMETATARWEGGYWKRDTWHVFPGT